MPKCIQVTERLGYQQQLDDAREALAEGEITQDELEALHADLIEDMPEAVRARLPEDHPAAQAKVAKVTAAPENLATNGPSLDGLQGFAPPAPPGV